MIDTVGLKAAPLATVHGRPLPLDRRRSCGRRPGFAPYCRSTVDQDTANKGLQVEFTVGDERAFTTPWSERVTFRRLIGDSWPEAAAPNPTLFGKDAAIPTAHTPDFGAREERGSIPEGYARLTFRQTQEALGDLTSRRRPRNPHSAIKRIV